MRSVIAIVSGIRCRPASPARAARRKRHWPVKFLIFSGLVEVLVTQAPTANASLISTAGGMTVYDTANQVTWLADADLPATLPLGVSGINPVSGSMSYAAAVQWVKALNSYNGSGYLGHDDWTLPATPAVDTTCAATGAHGKSFGFGCENSAMGSLYYESLKFHPGDSVVSSTRDKVGPFRNLQAYLYWSQTPATPGVGGYKSFSFNSGWQGSNVATNDLYVFPMIKGKLSGTPPSIGNALQLNPGGQTVYDPVTNITWLTNADLPASNSSGINCVNKNGTSCVINPDGSMTQATAQAWIRAMNAANNGVGYLGHSNWQLPTATSDAGCSIHNAFGFGCIGNPMGELFYRQLALSKGDPAVMTPNATVGPFNALQPYLYWSCQGTLKGGCEESSPSPGFEWSFSFGSGFEGTDILQNDLYVTAYYPGSSATIPEPAMFTLFALGLTGLGLLRRTS